MKALLIALKEVKSYLQDRADLAFSLLLPIAVFALMYGAFGGSITFHGTAYIVNQDPGGTYSSLLLDRLEQNPSLTVVKLSQADADTRLERSDILMVVEIPPDFSRNLANDRPAQLTFRQRGNGGQEGQIVSSFIRSAASELQNNLSVEKQVETALAGQNIPAAQIQTTVQQYIARGESAPLVTVQEQSVGVKPDVVRQFVPGIMTMFVLFALTLSARSIIEERKKSTLERLMTTRLTATELFFGKFAASVARGFVQTLILMLLAFAVFRIFTPLSFLTSLVVAILFAASASAIGMVIASVARSEDSATWISVFFTMATVMLGGTFFTISPGTIWETLSKISLNAYANDAFKAVLIDSATVGSVAGDLIVMAGVVVVGLVISRMLFRVIPGGR